MDVHNKETRSYNMSQIKGKNTKPEVKVRKHLFSRGFRYRVNDRRYPGTPDIILPKHKTVVFVNGCFWHRHEGCKYTTIPSTNTEFWLGKFKKNVENDAKNYNALAELGWQVIVVWECEIKHDFLKTMDQIEMKINGHSRNTNVSDLED